MSLPEEVVIIDAAGDMHKGRLSKTSAERINQSVGERVLPENLVNQLIAIGKELAHQDNLGTNWPVWVVMERKKIYVDYMQSWDEKERQSPDYFNVSDLCDDCRKAYEENEVPETCELDMCDESTFAYFNWEDVPSFWKGSGIFLTQKACQEYIDDNSYDFTNPRTYAYSAHRNYELQPIIQALILMAGEEVSSNHYGVVK